MERPLSRVDERSPRAARYRLTYERKRVHHNLERVVKGAPAAGRVHGIPRARIEVAVLTRILEQQL